MRVSTIFLLACASASNTHAQCPPQELRAADVSFVPQIEAAGGVFRDESGSDADIMALLSSRGFNAVRLRVWIAPADGYCNLAHTCQMAQRAQAVGLSIVLDLHYSDTWADPGQQTIPAAWAGQSQAQLRQSIEAYTHDTLQSLILQGTPASVVQIGNEVTAGMLWPMGRVGGAFDSNWPNFAELLSAAGRGARAVSPAPLIMIHIDRGGDNAGTRWFFDHVEASGVSYDMIGLSYYPWWHGDFASMQSNIEDVAARYAKRVFIAETAYPWTLQWSDNTHNFVGNVGQLLTGYAASMNGQSMFLKDLLAAVRRLPMQRGAGVAYWAPEWSAFPGVGSPYENLSLFDFQHRACAALAAWNCCPADVNHDGALDFFDYLDFVDAFSSFQTAADYNQDGGIDFFDYLDFVDEFSSSC